MWRWSGSWTGKEGTMVMRSACNDASGGMHNQHGMHRRGGGRGLLLPGGPHQFARCAGDHPTDRVREEDRVRAKVRRAASFSHSIACGGNVGTRPISPVVQYGRARGAVAAVLSPERTTAAPAPRPYAGPRHETSRSCHPNGAWRQQPAAATWRVPPWPWIRCVLLAWSPSFLAASRGSERRCPRGMQEKHRHATGMQRVLPISLLDMGL